MNLYNANFNSDGGPMTLSFKVAAHNTYNYGIKTRKFGASFEPVEQDGYVDPDDNLNDEYEIPVDGMDNGTILVGYIVYNYPGPGGQLVIPVDISQDGGVIASINHIVAKDEAGTIGSFAIKTAA